jgi:excisionase family DNA binding protein
MLSNLLSDSFKKTNKHLLERDTRNKLSPFGFGLTVIHNDLGCSSENHPQWPIKKRLVLKNLLLKLGVILTHPLFTVTTLWEHLAISRATLYRLINKGEIEPIRIGSLTRFTEKEVNRFLSRQQQQARAQEVGF